MKYGEDNKGIFGIDSGVHPDELPAFESLDALLADPSAIRNNVSVRAPLSRGRLKFAVFVCLLALGIFTGRTAYLQIYQGEYYRDIAESNRIRIHSIPSHRGILTDRNGIVLAENLASFRLVAYASALPKKEKFDALVKEVAVRFGLTEEDIREKITDAGKAEEILLKEDVPYDTAVAALADPDALEGVSVELSERRGYPTDAIPSLSHVLGYTGSLNAQEYAALQDDGYRQFDVAGKQGIEAAHEKDLRGTFGEEVVEVNAQGELLRAISRKEPQDGKDLTLTIDARLQAYSEQVLQKYFENRPVKRGAVVAINPQNGEVLALVSYPAFDANLFSQGISSEAYKALLDDPDAPLFPRATSGQYPSGSVIKPIFAAAALTEGIITPQTTFLSTGGLMLGDRFFPDWRPGGHGITNVYHAIADSVNTFFYMIGGGNESFKGLGVEKLMEWAGKFGLGHKSGIDLTGEADGFLPSKEWKEEVKGEPWYIGDTYNVSIGQGDILVTPLQMARATAAVANGGMLMEPHLVIGEETTEPVRVVAEDIDKIVRDGMRDTVTNGTARSLQSLPVDSGGKTGTAQWNVNKVPHSWFTGFAPFENPQITICVLVEQGGDITAAVPIARDILQWYFSQKH
jgi:penicillin-binding protein 2